MRKISSILLFSFFIFIVNSAVFIIFFQFDYYAEYAEHYESDKIRALYADLLYSYPFYLLNFLLLAVIYGFMVHLFKLHKPVDFLLLIKGLTILVVVILFDYFLYGINWYLREGMLQTWQWWMSNMTRYYLVRVIGSWRVDLLVLIVTLFTTWLFFEINPAAHNR